MVLVEAPTWECCNSFANLPTFWARTATNDSIMVLDGYNHPCIWGWSMANEPGETTLGAMFATDNTIIHNLESVAPTGRVTLVANMEGTMPGYAGDVFGRNYAMSDASALPFVNTENYGDWFRTFVRGNPLDLDTSTSSKGYDQAINMHNWWTATDKCAGAHFWCFMDYCSLINTVGREGIVDRLYVPKNVYYMVRRNETGAAADFWVKGTPTSVDVSADLATLRADGTDLSRIVATLRAGTRCVQEDCKITFTASPASCCTGLYPGDTAATTAGDPVTVSFEGGRAAILLRTSRTPGTITVSATTSCNLPVASVTVTSVAATEVLPALSWDNVSVLPQNRCFAKEVSPLKLEHNPKGVLISFAQGEDRRMGIIGCQGRILASFSLKKGVSKLIPRSTIGSGVFFAVWEAEGKQGVTRFTIAGE